MHLVTPLVLPEFHDRFQTPLAVGIVFVFLVHCFFLDHYALPALPLRRHTKFATATAAAFLVFVGATLGAYEWLLPTMVNRACEQPAIHNILLLTAWSRYSLFASTLCFGCGLLCESLAATILLRFADQRPLPKATPAS